MAAIKSRNTKPEMIVRHLVRQLGFGYRLHAKDLPGKPDLVFRGRRKVIFVHGCYWHMHNCKYGSVVPKTRTEFWQTKRQANVNRDIVNNSTLSVMGWKILVIWECELADTSALSDRLLEFLQ